MLYQSLEFSGTPPQPWTVLRYVWHVPQVDLFFSKRKNCPFAQEASSASIVADLWVRCTVRQVSGLKELQV